jgi:RimJ/RimL family protein N-acetyltransferase
MRPAPRIETDRLLLTWPTAEQIDGYYAAILGTRMFDTILWDGPSGPGELHEYWDGKQADPSLEVAIIEKSTRRYIGGTGLRVVGGDPAILDVSYALAPVAHGKGYATEAVVALVGFRYEGTLRRAVRKRGIWLDEWLLAVTRPDWEAGSAASAR